MFISPSLPLSLLIIISPSIWRNTGPEKMIYAPLYKSRSGPRAY